MLSRGLLMMAIILASVPVQAFEYLNTQKPTSLINATTFSEYGSIRHQRKGGNDHYTQTLTGITLNYNPAHFKITSQLVSQSFNNNSDNINQAHIQIGYLFSANDSLPIYSAVSRTQNFKKHKGVSSLTLSSKYIKGNTFSEINLEVSQYDDEQINLALGISRIVPLITNAFFLLNTNFEYFSYKEIDHIELNNDSLLSLQLGVGADLGSHWQASIMFNIARTDDISANHPDNNGASVIQQGGHLSISGKF